MFKTTVEPEDDEILVYDWSNSGIPRPARPEKIVGKHVPALKQTPNSMVNGSAYASSYQPYPNGVSHPYQQYNSGYNFSPQGSYQNVQNCSSYWGQSYNLRPPTNFNGTKSASFGHSYFGKAGSINISQNDEEDDWLDSVEEIDYSKSSQQWSQNGSTSKSKSGKRSKKRVETRSPQKDLNLSPLLDDVEEIDYSNMHLELETKSSDVGPEKPVEPEPPKPPVTPILSVPKSSLSLDEVLPEISKKSRKCPTLGIQNSRKRPRNELEKSDEMDLEDLLSKHKHRVSARSYAKPTRKAECSLSLSQATANLCGSVQSRVSPPLSLNEKSKQRSPTINGDQQSRLMSCSTSPVSKDGKFKLIRASPKDQDKKRCEPPPPPSLYDKNKKPQLTPPSPPSFSDIVRAPRVGSLREESNNHSPSSSASRENLDEQNQFMSSSHSDDNDNEDSVDNAQISDSVCFDKSMQDTHNEIQDMEEDEIIEIPLKIRTDIFEAEGEEDDDE